MERGQQNPSTPSREQYVIELSKKLDEWDLKVETITSKDKRSQMDSVLLDDLLQKQAAAHEWLNEVKESDNAMWEELKAQASVASQDYQDVLERAAERFKVDGPRTAAHASQRQEGGSGPQKGGAGTQTTPTGGTASESVPQNEGEGSEDVSRRSSRESGGTETSDSG